MGVIRYTVTTYHCPRCKLRLDYLDKGGRNLYKIGPPFLLCPPCGITLLVPSGANIRHDEWEMKEQATREEALAWLLKDHPYDSEGSWYIGGCFSALAMIAAIGVAAWLGAKDIFNNTPVMRSIYGVGGGVFLGILVLLPLLHRLRSPVHQAKLTADTIDRIEESRKRMADPAYREKLRDLGVPVRFGDAEPAFVAEELARLKKRLEMLRAGSS